MIAELGFADRVFVSHRSFACVPVVLDGSQCGRCKDFAKDEGRTLLGRGLALPGSLGCCGIAHDSQRLEGSRDVRAARRALLLVKKEPFVGWNSGLVLLLRH